LNEHIDEALLGKCTLAALRAGEERTWAHEAEKIARAVLLEGMKAPHEELIAASIERDDARAGLEAYAEKAAAHDKAIEMFRVDYSTAGLVGCVEAVLSGREMWVKKSEELNERLDKARAERDEWRTRAEVAERSLTMFDSLEMERWKQRALTAETQVKREQENRTAIEQGLAKELLRQGEELGEARSTLAVRDREHDFLRKGRNQAVDALDAARSKLGDSIAEHQRNIAAQSQAYAELKGERDLLQEQLDRVSNQSEARRAHMVDLTNERDEWRARYARLEANDNDLIAANDKFAREAKELLIRTQEAEHQRDVLVSKVKSLESGEAIKDLRADHDDLLSANRRLASALEAERNMLAGKRHSHAELAKEHREVRQELEALPWIPDGTPAQYESARRMIKEQKADPSVTDWSPGCSLRPTVPQLIAYWKRCVEQYDSPDPFARDLVLGQTRASRRDQLEMCIRELEGAQHVEPSRGPNEPMAVAHADFTAPLDVAALPAHWDERRRREGKLDTSRCGADLRRALAVSGLPVPPPPDEPGGPNPHYVEPGSLKALTEACRLIFGVEPHIEERGPLKAERWQTSVKVHGYSLTSRHSTRESALASLIGLATSRLQNLPLMDGSPLAWQRRADA
jgi:hypothetical protein